MSQGSQARGASALTAEYVVEMISMSSSLTTSWGRTMTGNAGFVVLPHVFIMHKSGVYADHKQWHMHEQHIAPVANAKLGNGADAS